MSAKLPLTMRAFVPLLWHKKIFREMVKISNNKMCEHLANNKIDLLRKKF